VSGFFYLYILYMKILKFKLFENKEYSDETKEGFKYSELEVKEFLQDLMDNCDLEINSLHSILTDENFDGGGLKGISEATWCGFEITLHKEVHEDKKFIWRETGSYPRKTIYLNDSFDELSIYKELKDLSQRFEKFFHHLTVNPDGYFLRLVLLNKVDEYEKEERKRKNKESKYHEEIVDKFYRIRKVIMDTKTLSVPFRKDMGKNKLGEYSYIFQGSFKDGFLILPINTSNLSKLVLKNNLPKIEYLVDQLLSFKWINKCELRLITIMINGLIHL
jgi:hypothetical protein